MRRQASFAASAVVFVSTSLAYHAPVWSPASDVRGDIPTTTDAGLVDIKFAKWGHDVEYYVASVAFGSPPQPVWLALDIALADTMVVSYRVGNHSFYDHTQSSTYKANSTKVDLRPLLAGVAQDSITISSSKGAHHLTAIDQLFLELEGPDDRLQRFAIDD